MSGVNKIEHRLLGKISEPAMDSQEIEIEIRFDPDDPHSIPTVALSSTDWSFKEAAIINQHVIDFGIHAGIPYTQTVSDDTSTLTLLDAYLDPAGDDTLFECDIVRNIPVVLTAKNDWLTEASKNVLFNILLSNGTITTGDYVQVPYIISKIPNYTEAAVATLTAFLIVTKTIEIGREITKVVGVLFTGALGAIGAIITLIIVVLWVILVLALIIILIIDIVGHLIQPIKYHAGMKWARLLEAGCEHLGLNFVSTIFEEEKYRDAVIIPSKKTRFKDPKLPDFLGFLTPSDEDKGYYKKSFFDLLQLTKTTFNAKIIINANKDLIIERVDKATDLATLKLPDLPLDEYRTNASEIIGNYEVAFLTDLSDDNTTDNYEGTTTNAITSSESIKQEGTSNIPNYLLKQINLSRATRKKELTDIEQRLSELIQSMPAQINEINNLVDTASKAVDSVIKSVTKTIRKLKLVGIPVRFNPQPVPKIPPITVDQLEKRIGMMSASDDHFDIDKVMSLDIGTDPSFTSLKEDNDTIWHSETLYNEFHVTQSHAVTDEFPFGNQFRRYELGDFKLCLDDVIKIINNNLIFTKDGRSAKIETLRWRPFDGVATGGKIRIPYVSDTFLNTITVTEDGL